MEENKRIYRSGIVIDLRNYYTKEEVLDIINGDAVTTDTE